MTAITSAPLPTPPLPAAYAPCPCDPTNIANPTILALRQKRAERLQVLRGQERANSIAKSQEYRGRLGEARLAMRAQAQAEAEQQRDDELKQVGACFIPKIEQGTSSAHLRAPICCTPCSAPPQTLALGPKP